MTTKITQGSADVLAKIMQSQQNDPFFADVINEFIARAKLKYDGLGRTFELSKEVSDYWDSIRLQEDVCRSLEAQGEPTNRERAELSYMNEHFRELQIEFHRSRHHIQAQLGPDEWSL